MKAEVLIVNIKDMFFYIYTYCCLVQRVKLLKHDKGSRTHFIWHYSHLIVYGLIFIFFNLKYTSKYVQIKDEKIHSVALLLFTLLYTVISK